MLAAALCLAVAQPAAAQVNPSTDQIINALKPTGNLGGTTRGIRPSVMTAPTAPEAGSPPGQSAPAQAARPRPTVPASSHAVATAPPVAEQHGSASVNLTVDFATGSVQITPQAARTLQTLGRALADAALAPYRFRIEGHTDTVGSPEANKVLSERRAAAVVDYIVANFHVDRARLEPIGMGEDGLLVPTRPQVAEPRNRRVQVVNISA